MGRCRRTVQRYLRQLEDAGYIDVHVIPSRRTRMCVGLVGAAVRALFPRHAWPNAMKPGATGMAQINRNQIQKRPVPRTEWALRCVFKRKVGRQQHPADRRRLDEVRVIYRQRQDDALLVRRHAVVRGSRSHRSAPPLCASPGIHPCGRWTGVARASDRRTGGWFFSITFSQTKCVEDLMSDFRTSSRSALTRTLSGAPPEISPRWRCATLSRSLIASDFLVDLLDS